MAIAKATKGFMSKQMSNTRGETIGMAAVTGVAVGTTNNQINKNYVQKGKSAYTRRHQAKHGLARKGGV